jgi:hypothetical protein
LVEHPPVAVTLKFQVRGVRGRFRQRHPVRHNWLFLTLLSPQTLPQQTQGRGFLVGLRLICSIVLKTLGASLSRCKHGASLLDPARARFRLLG